MLNTHHQARNEFQVLIVVICIMVGMSQVFFAEVPKDLRDLGTGYQSVWSWTLLVGGVLAMAGILIKDAYWGLLFELAGMLSLGFATAAYAVAIIASSAQAASLVSTPIMLAFSIASMIRSGRIIKKLTRHGRTERLAEEVNKQLGEQLTEKLQVDLSTRPPEDEEP